MCTRALATACAVDVACTCAPVCMYVHVFQYPLYILPWVIITEVFIKSGSSVYDTCTTSLNSMSNDSDCGMSCIRLIRFMMLEFGGNNTSLLTKGIKLQT